MLNTQLLNFDKKGRPENGEYRSHTVGPVLTVECTVCVPYLWS